MSGKNQAVMLPKALLGLALGPVLTLGTGLTPATAATPTPAAVAPAVLKAGQSSLNYLLRYRLEYVDQDGLPEQALASTLLTRLTAGQGLTDTLSAGVEFDYVAALGDSHYNNSFNGNSRYPVIADPTGADLNQAFVQYQSAGHLLKVGRQKINLGNERFVGSVGWRQNEQTFDAVRYQTALSSAVKLDYSFSNRVNRVFGSDSPQGDWRSDIHLLDLNYSLSATQQLKFFAYTLDLREAPALSSQTLGVDYQQSGSLGGWQYQLAGAYAQQQDYADNPQAYQASYHNIEAQLQHGAWLLGAGYEKLGSDRNIGFSTPLATLHKFQGFADKFLATPANGVRDLQVKAGIVQMKWDLQLQYHWLDAATGGADYGNELDLTLLYKFSPQYALLVKAAQYDARHYQTDTGKFWLQWLAKF